MSDSQLAVAQPPFVKASTQLSTFLGIETSMMIETLKAQCFKGLRPEQVSDAQLAAFVSTANALQVNPLLPGFLYAYPERNGGITPILGPDGVLKKLDEFITSGKLEGYECIVYPEDVTQKPTHATATIHRHGSTKPATYTAIFSEWVVGQSPTWNSKPRHMLWIRAIKQAARQVIHGLPMDADEYKLSQMLNVTENDEGAPAETPPPERPAPKERAKRGAAGAKAAEVVVTQEEQKVVDQPAEPAKPAEDIQKQMEARQAKTEAAKIEPAKTEAKADAPTPRAFLQDGEKLTVIAKVETMEAVAGNVNGKRFPAIKALLSGGFNGDVRHKEGGARFIYVGDKETGIEALPPWKVGAVLSFNLIGQKSTSASLNGKVLVFVESVSAVGESASAVDQGEAME